MKNGTWKDVYKVLGIAFVSIAWIPVRAQAHTNIEKIQFEFQGGSSLILYQSLKNFEAKDFGPGWKKANFVDASGSRIPLFPMEPFAATSGLIFAQNYSPRISSSGKYAALDVLRTGNVEPGPSGGVEQSSKQYCPVLNTAAGCIVSMQTGELCGGDWSESDTWIVTGYQYNATKSMIEYKFPGANELWSQFLESVKTNGIAKIEQYLASNLGVANLMACEPPTIANKNSLALIAQQLRKEGDLSDAEFIEERLTAAAIATDLTQVVSIKVDKAYLYERPDITGKTRAYLVKGDAIKKLESTDGWIRIEYVKKNGAVIDKWIQSISIR
jgi:hypothetical protein